MICISKSIVTIIIIITIIISIVLLLVDVVDLPRVLEITFPIIMMIYDYILIIILIIASMCTCSRSPPFFIAGP